MLYYPNASCKIQQSGNHECQVFQTTTVVITFFLIRIHSIDCNLFFLILECQKHKLFTDHASITQVTMLTISHLSKSLAK